MTKREKTTALFIELINEQLKPYGVTHDDVKENPAWPMEYYTTIEQQKEFMQYCIDRMQSVLNLSRSMAEKEAQCFIIQWGVIIKSKVSPELSKNKNQKTL